MIGRAQCTGVLRRVLYVVLLAAATLTSAAQAETCSQLLASGTAGQRALADFWQGYLSGFNLDHVRHVQERQPAISLSGYANGKRVDLANADRLESYCRVHGDAPLAEAADAVFDQLQHDLGGETGHE